MANEFETDRDGSPVAEEIGRWRTAWLAVLVVVAGIALQLPSLGMGFYGDDWIHQIVLRGHSTATIPLRPWNLYDFGTAADWNEAASQSGWTPIWWISPDWKIRFARPLASLSIWADHALWGTAAAGYHATSLAWYLLVLVLVLAVYRALGLAPAASRLATALYAVTNGAAIPVGWIANRNTVMETAFTLGAVLSALRLRGKARIALSIGLAALATACRETGAIAFVFVAIAFATDERGEAPSAARSRWTAATIALLGAAVALGVLLWLGVGEDSGFYATPWHDPLGFLGRSSLLLTAGLLRLVFPLPLDLLFFFPAAALPLAVVSAAIAWPLAAMMARQLRGRPSVVFLACWLLLSLVAEGSSPPSDRLLFRAAFGSAGLIAIYLSQFKSEDLRPRSRAHRVAWWSIIVAAGLSCLGATLQPWSLAKVSAHVRDAVAAVDPGPLGVDQRVDAVVLQNSDAFVSFVLPFMRGPEASAEPVRFSIFQVGERGLLWKRENDSTCVLQSTGRPFLVDPFERVYRSRSGSLEVGDLLPGPLYTVEVLGSDEGDPTAVRLRFEKSLDDSSVRFLVPMEGRLQVIEAPLVGEEKFLPPASLAAPLG